MRFGGTAVRCAPMRMRMLIGAVLGLMAGAPLAAHDFWLAAVDWTPAAGDPVALTAGIGERFPARTIFRPGTNRWLAQWRVIGAEGELPHGGFHESDLALRTDIAAAPGAYLAVAAVTPQLTEMSGNEFTEYLREERLAHVIAVRDALAESGLIATERYYRFAKVAVRNGPGSAAHLTRPVGLPAEFVPSSDPTALRPGEPLTVQLLIAGEPVPDAAVSAVSGETVIEGRTDAEGRATLPIDAYGPWLIRTVQMQRLPPSDYAEWESYWVTLAFHTAR